MVSFNIEEIKSTESTNAYLKNMLAEKEYPEGTCIITNEQTSGKGQQGNSWESEPGKNLTFSFVLKPQLEAYKMFLVSKVVSLAIIDLLNVREKNFTIKWPNDIYFENKKIAGILIENQLLGSKLKHSLIGIGLNVNQEIFRSDAPNPISLIQILKKESNLENTLHSFFKELNKWYSELQNGNYELINKCYKANSFRITGFHKYACNNEVFDAEITDIAEDGQLHLKARNGENRAFYFKEVEYYLAD